jgi:hypothetical protein
MSSLEYLLTFSRLECSLTAAWFRMRGGSANGMMPRMEQSSSTGIANEIE